MDELEQKVYNGEQLTEEELSDLAWHENIETIYGESGRWQQSVSLIFKIGDKFFELDFERGLTEYQSNNYGQQPYEVFMHSKQVTETKVWYDTSK